MFRFIHTADWQLGARFSQFGASGRRLREARLSTLGKALALARQHAADAFLVAGDLFEDNQVDESLVAFVGEIFAEHPSVPVYVLPGNHDPFTGPESVWQRKSVLSWPAHVRLLTTAGATDLGGVFLLASPLQQKLSTTDPSFRFIELAKALPAHALKIGITHGALAIEGKHQPNDFPIALNAATRAGLDYLAIGHWHNWLAETDGGRVVMPGTPEPDRFANDAAGHVALVEIAARGELPMVKPLSVNTLSWRSVAFDFLSLDASRASLEGLLTDLRPHAERSVLRVTFNGTASPKALVETRDWVETALAPFLVGQIVDRTRIALSSVELADLQSRHPLLAQSLADIDRLESLATGENRGVAATPSADGASEVTQPALTLADAQALLAPSKIDLANLTPEFFSHLRQMLFQTLQEVAS